MINQAIQKAVDGGYKRPRYMDGRWVIEEQIFLDKNFWQSLGKALGWEDKINPKFSFYRSRSVWLHNWHIFINHLAENKDPEKFFKDLLK